jgi:hypothetical protein
VFQSLVICRFGDLLILGSVEIRGKEAIATGEIDSSTVRQINK